METIQWIGFYLGLVLACLIIGYLLFSNDYSDRG